MQTTYAKGAQTLCIHFEARLEGPGERVCMCVYVYMCIHTYNEKTGIPSAYVCVCMYAPTYMKIFVYRVHVCTHMHVHTVAAHIYAHIETNTHTRNARV